jgi:hypothetical protein
MEEKEPTPSNADKHTEEIIPQNEIVHTEHHQDACDEYDNYCPWE